MVARANENRQTAKTAHVEGTGSFTLKGGFSVSFDFKFSGDAEMPDKSRMNVQMAMLGQALSIDALTVDGRNFTKENGFGWIEGGSSARFSPFGGSGTLDPLSQLDLANLGTVTEVDRPQVEGKTTRHLAYTVDPKKLVEKLQQTTDSKTFAAFQPSNMSAQGELWIRTEDSQIVRQTVRVAFDLDFSGISYPGSTPAAASGGSFESSFDVKLTHIGEPLSPAITAPPTVAPVRTPSPFRTNPPFPAPRTPTPRPTA